jgi:L-lactate utilization protein LutB
MVKKVKLDESWRVAPFEAVQEALRKNRMAAHFAATPEAARELALSLIPPGASVGLGGSMTLEEIGLVGAVRGGNYRLLDRYQPGLTDGELRDIFRANFSANVFLTSTNALTAGGELVNKDGRGTRMAAVVYGPDRVIVVAGRNKLVKDVAAGLERIETVAAPRNSARLKVNTPCVQTGRCMDCRSPQRICCHTVISGFQRVPDRIHVILVDSDLGY